MGLRGEYERGKGGAETGSLFYFPQFPASPQFDKFSLSRVPFRKRGR